MEIAGEWVSPFFLFAICYSTYFVQYLRLDNLGKVQYLGWGMTLFLPL